MSKAESKKKKSTFIADLKKFIMRGNVLDLAVAVVVGAAFNGIVSSFVNDLLMPLLGILTGKVSLSALQWIIVEATEESAGIIVKYGAFLQKVVDFLIIAFVIFVVVRLFNKVKTKLNEDETEKKKAADEAAKLVAEKAAKEKAEADAKAIAEANALKDEEHKALLEIRDLLKASRK